MYRHHFLLCFMWWITTVSLLKLHLMKRSMKKCMLSLELPCSSNSERLFERASSCVRARARLHNRWSWSRSSCRWTLVDLNANLATGRHGSAFEEGSHMFSLTSQKCHAVFSPPWNVHPRARSHRRAWVRMKPGIRVTPGDPEIAVKWWKREQISWMETRSPCET